MLRGIFAVAALALLAPGCASVPGGTQAPVSLQKELLEGLSQVDSLSDPVCVERRVVSTEVVKVYKGRLVILERWVLDRCGRRVNYHVSYTPDPETWGGHAVLIIEQS